VCVRRVREGRAARSLCCCVPQVAGGCCRSTAHRDTFVLDLGSPDGKATWRQLRPQTAQPVLVGATVSAAPGPAPPMHAGVILSRRDCTPCAGHAAPLPRCPSAAGPITASLRSVLRDRAIDLSSSE
jgi:hypothetical protein